jgi:hypothetical protein
MIYVIEVPHQGDPTAWFAFNGEDLLNKVAVNDTLASWEVYDCSSARDLIEMVGQEAESAQAESQFPGICRLAKEFGWDTPLYRADYLLERGAYQPEAVSIEAACEAALKKRVTAEPADGALKDLRIYWSDPQAVLATEGAEPMFQAQGGWRALHVLREQLLSLEVLAEN